MNATGPTPGTLDPAVRRLAVIGDVGGHATELVAELTRLGMGPDGRLPDDLAVIQVGDLVHRGPDSATVIGLVGGFLTRQPGQWQQLVGNHELLYLDEPQFVWPERIAGRDARTLAHWWSDGLLRPAAWCQVAGEDFLITHAGLTREFWLSLGAPASAELTAYALEDLRRTDPQRLFRPGTMLTGSTRARGPVGPIWASASDELVPSWAGHPLPFSQIHGHSSVLTWSTGQTRLPEPLRDRLRIDQQARHTELTLDGGRLIGIDPGHGRTPHPWRALELTW